MRQASERIIILANIFFLCQSARAQAVEGSVAREIQITQWIQPGKNPAELKDKYIVIDFWATWCAPCLASMPHMDSLHAKFNGEKDLVWLTMSDEPATRIKAALERFPTISQVVTDTTGSTLDSFGVFHIPITFLIDRAGVIRWKGHPQQLTESVLDEFLRGKIVVSEKPIIASSVPTSVVTDEKKKIDFSSLFQKYNDIVRDSTVTRFFEINTSVSGNLSASRQSFSPSVKLLHVGVRIRELFAQLLDCSPFQIYLPNDVDDNRKVSYCLKNPEPDTILNVRHRVIDSLLHFLKWEKTEIPEFLSFYSLKVIDSAKLSESRPTGQSASSSISVSDNNEIIGFKNCSPEQISSQISRLYGKIVKVTGVDSGDRYYLTLKNADFNELKESLLQYGIEITEKTQSVPVYYFSVDLEQAYFQRVTGRET